MTNTPCSCRPLLLVAAALTVLLVAVAPFARATPALNFLVVGDWGGDELSPYTTRGEVAVARVMGPIGDQIDSQFVVALGDNFYVFGVRDENDHRFLDTFENVFTAPVLQRPWYVIGGNHDHYGNITAQLAYSHKSSRWVFPDLYYTFTKTIPGTSLTVQFVMIDTVVLCGNSDDTFYDELPGASDPAAAEEQWTWIEAQLAASKADYLLVLGHYPVWSIAEHGPTSCLVSRLKPLLEQHNVTGYMCGHDHTLEYLDEGLGPVYWLVGATHLFDTSTAHIDSVPAGSLKFHWSQGLGGFASVSATPTGLSVFYYDDSGKILFASPSRPPRSSPSTSSHLRNQHP